MEPFDPSQTRHRPSHQTGKLAVANTVAINGYSSSTSQRRLHGSYFLKDAMLLSNASGRFDRSDPGKARRHVQRAA